MSKMILTGIKRGVNFYEASRDLSLNVAEYVRVFIIKKEINLAYAKKCEELTNSIVALDNLKGSIREDEIDTLKAAALDNLKKYEKERDDALEEQATYKKSENDKKLEKTFKSADLTYNKAVEALRTWFKVYNLDIEDSYLEEQIMGSFGSNMDIKTLAKSDALLVMKGDYNKVLNKVYGICYEHMINRTIKPVQIPELVREKYCGKKKNKK